MLLVTMTVWPKYGIGRLHVEGEQEAHRALADIGREMVDVGIAGQRPAFEALDLVAGFGDRRVLRQVPVDDQLRPVRRREELLLDKAEAGYRAGKQQHGDEDRQPVMAHRAHQHAPKQLVKRPGLLMFVLHRRRQDGDAEQRRKQHRHDP